MRNRYQFVGDPRVCRRLAGFRAATGLVIALAVAALAFTAPAGADERDEPCPKLAVDVESFITCDDVLPEGPQQMSAGQVHRLRRAGGNVLLIDVRRSGETAAPAMAADTDIVARYAEETVEREDGTPVTVVSPAVVDAIRAHVAAAGGDLGTVLLLVCRDGVLAAQVAAALHAAGFVHTRVVADGYDGPRGWIAAGLPMRSAVQ